MPTILYIDDTENNRILVTRRLEKRGYQVVTAENAGQGLALAASSLHLTSTSNPEGIVSSSPGLRGTSYPGKSSRDMPTLKGLRRRFAVQNNETRPATLSGLSPRDDCQPRVARSSQPWALCRNPF